MTDKLERVDQEMVDLEEELKNQEGKMQDLKIQETESKSEVLLEKEEEDAEPGGDDKKMEEENVEEKAEEGAQAEEGAAGDEEGFGRDYEPDVDWYDSDGWDPFKYEYGWDDM